MITELFEQLSTVLESKQIHLKQGDVLFQQSSEVSRFYYINTGKLKLIRNTKDGVSVLLHIGQRGESIAEASLFSAQYHCSAVAETPCRVTSISKQVFLHHIEDNPPVMMALLSIFARQIRDLRSMNELKNIHSAKDRILTYVRSRADEERRIPIDTSLKDIAQNIGLAHETFYRALKSLEESGELIRGHGFIQLL